ncbi:glycine cleavage system protein GcvH [Paenibacillus aurantius]|uniref:Glycine cleavage system H protein n=1 Tax=Paenibacillus aurantius TaxID=2918900 RepID=A0AA96LEU2_9BACL|nr:glycine cleavage system protein GcvH [Paenibacillus aurantius]WJH35081.1 glycine cleavage system protein GcvH [Paenibacillus sp. CC-CFT747]WNQ10337.1 glycine cleavage system protein GcvH [Paenibacillus aurantius]
MNQGEEIRYSEEHTWVRQEGKRVRLGMTDFAQNELGDIVFVELPETGDALKAGEPFGSVESIKSVTELYSPVSGKVVETNRALLELPGQVNLTPYASWMVVVELADPSELDKLWSKAKYEETFGTEEQ